MAKYYSTTHVHPYSWDVVASGIFLRYPNPFSTHVLSEDTVYRELRNNGNTLYTRRFLTKTNKIPKWGEKFLVNFKRMVPLVEESLVDRKTKRIVTYTRNVGLSRFMTATEKVSYVTNPDDPTKQTTVAVKEAWIESGLYGLRSAVKNFGIERFKENCHRATDGFNHVLQQLVTQQAYIKEVKQRKWLDVKMKSESLKETAKMAAHRAKAHTTVSAASVAANEPISSSDS